MVTGGAVLESIEVDNLIGREGVSRGASGSISISLIVIGDSVAGGVAAVTG